MVADTDKWEQSAAFALDTHPDVARWVKNDHVGFAIPWRKRSSPARYYRLEQRLEPEETDPRQH